MACLARGTLYLLSSPILGVTSTFLLISQSYFHYYACSQDCVGIRGRHYKNQAQGTERGANIHGQGLGMLMALVCLILTANPPTSHSCVPFSCLVFRVLSRISFCPFRSYEKNPGLPETLKPKPAAWLSLQVQVSSDAE